MAATAAEIAQLRRMTDLVGSTAYDDTTLQNYIEKYPTLDENGYAPGEWLLTAPPQWIVNPLWIPTYDLAAAAAQVWGEKAAALAPDYDFAADGGNYTRSQAYNQAMAQARYWESRQAAGTITLASWPRPTLTSEVIGNLAEPD